MAPPLVYDTFEVILEENKITSLLVADEHNKLIGALNIHDLFREGLM